MGGGLVEENTGEVFGKKERQYDGISNHDDRYRWWHLKAERR